MTSLITKNQFGIEIKRKKFKILDYLLYVLFGAYVLIR